MLCYDIWIYFVTNHVRNCLRLNNPGGDLDLTIPFFGSSHSSTRVHLLMRYLVKGCMQRLATDRANFHYLSLFGFIRVHCLNRDFRDDLPFVLDLLPLTVLLGSMAFQEKN